MAGKETVPDASNVPLINPTSSLQVALDGGRGYPIYFARHATTARALHAAGLRPGRCLVVTDDNVAPLYADRLETALADAGWRPHRIVLPAGESSKSLGQLSALYDQILPLGIDRGTPLLALGGGVVGDLAGFTAATLLRGLPLVHLPTTVIAQVDSAIGGKTGINHAVGKNLIGAFYQPQFVLADLDTLHTLPDREWTSGLAELLKHALIADADFAAWLTDRIAALIDRDRAVMAEALPRAAAIKAEVVSADEREAGRRAILNFGHTFGHAIERVAGYGTFTHGEAVALGMQAALHLSATLHPEIDVAPARRLLEPLPVPGSLAGLDVDELLAAMAHDKKVQAGRWRLIVLDRIGHAYVTAEAPRSAIREAWHYAQSIAPA